ncbi:MAG: lipoprotein-releasing ABC transporter permease subunit [Gammaproteobacteria bacterium]
MFQPISLNIALRYIRAKRRNHFISFISLVSTLGLMLGVAVLIVVLSVMNGFGRELQTRILGMVPHATLNAYAPIARWEALQAQLEADPEVLAAAPLIEMQGMLSYGGSVMGVYLNGIEPEAERRVSILPQFVRDGRLDDLQPGGFGVILGQAIANQLGLVVGDKVTVILPQATVSPAGVMPRFKRLTLVATFEVGAEVDGILGYVHWQDAAKLARHPGEVMSMRLRFQDLFDAPQIVHRLMRQPDILQLQQYYARDWTLTHGTLFEAIKMEKTMIALLLTLIMAVATFNIVSSLVMLVHEKKGDIAVLRTLGASPGLIRRVFMIQGTLIGLIGTTMGVLLGIVLALTVTDMVQWLEQVLHRELLGAYFINYLPSELQLEDVLIIAGLGLSLSFFATIYPARRAALLPPAETLRYED